jgi:hypothetical protein
MASWGDFTATLGHYTSVIANNAAKIIPNFGVTLETAARSSAEGLAKSPITTAADRDKIAREQIDANAPFKPKPIKPSQDLLLKTAVFAEDKIISPYITRPLSTAALMTDFSSKPLYADGFQWDDFGTAYNRSKFVSPFQALVKSDLYQGIPLVGVWTSGILHAGGINVDKVDLWDDQSIQKNFHDNVVGKWFTGVGDFLETSVAMAGVGKILGTAAKAGKALAVESAISAGTKEKSLVQFEQDINAGINNHLTGVGAPTVRGNDIIQMSQTSDPMILLPKLEKYTTNPNLIPLVAEATDPQLVRDLILADNGHLPALQRLAEGSSSDYLMLMSDVNHRLTSEAIMNNNSLSHLPDEALNKINKAFDDSIARTPEHARFRDAFMDSKGNLEVGGTGYMPAEPILGAKQVIGVRNAMDKLSASAATRDFVKLGDYGRFDVRTIGGALATRMVRLSTTRMPMGIVKFTGVRPFDAYAEINAQFDALDVFKNGNQVIEYEWGKTALASDYRKAILTAYSQATTDVGRRAIVESMDGHLGHIIGKHYGITSSEDIAGYIAAVKNATQGAYSGLIKKGFGIDMHGRLMIDPNTQSELAQAYRFSPWDVFESDIKRMQAKNVVSKSARTSGEVAKSVFEDGIKYWSFDVLARPAFIFKQSFMEPIISAGLAQGADFLVGNIPNMTTNFFKNMSNRVLGASAKVSTYEERKAIANTVTHIQEQLKKAIDDRDHLHANWDVMFQGKILSPVTRKQNGAYIKNLLKDADKRVEAMEAELNDAVRPLGMKPTTVPSVASLENRIAYIEQNVPSLRRSMKKQIADAKKNINALKKELVSVGPDGTTLAELNDRLAASYEDINFQVKNLGSVHEQQADVFGKSNAFKKRYYGKESTYRMVNGQYVSVPSLFDENLYGAAMRDELSNAKTIAKTYAGDLNVGSRQAIFQKRRPNGTIEIYNTDYFPELAHVFNRLWRNDPLFQQIFANKSEKELVKWLDQNPAYLEQWGNNGPVNLAEYVKEKVSLVNRYIPNEDVKALLLEREVNDLELKKMLSRHEEQLTALQPTDINYDMMSAQSDIEGGFLKGTRRIEAGLNSGISRIFQQLAKPENPIRWAYADARFADTVAKKAEILAKQGVSFDGAKGIERLNALRQAAAREVVKDTEKTFYTVRRELRMMRAARLVASFPTATFSAFYRYARLAAQNPYRTLGFLHYYDGAFGNFGVDEYGNHVKDPMQAQYLIVPGTEDINLKIGNWTILDNKPVRLNAKSLGFLLNYPSPSVYTTLVVGAVQHNYPNAEDTMKNMMGQYYDIIFPFGTQTNVLESLTPGWARDGFSYLRGPKGRKDWQESLLSVWDYHATLHDMDPVKNPMPTEKQVIDETTHLFHVKAFFEFASPYGVPVKVDTRPYQTIVDYYKTLFNKFTSQGLPYDEAKKKAGEEMISHLGADFPVERAAMSNKIQKFYKPPTWDSYNRLTHDFPDLVSGLYSLDKTDPKILELLTYDIPRDAKFNNTVYNLFNDPNAKLSNGQPMNTIIPSPAEKERLLQNQKTWTLYFAHKQAILDLPNIKAAGFTIENFSKIKGASEEMAAYADKVLSAQNPDWYNSDYMPQQTSNKSFIWGRGIWMLTHDDKFMAKHGQSKFWQDAKDFIQAREEMAKVYNSYPTGSKVKSYILRQYPAIVEKYIGQWDPKLQELIQMRMNNDSLSEVSRGSN